MNAKRTDVEHLKTDVLICGAGIIGLTIAYELIKRGYEEIIILEKEAMVGKHASGRNSGVLHAGIYYQPDTLRARLCLKGNRLIKDYCKRNGLPVLERGKVIVARNDKEVEALKWLYQNAMENGAKVEMIDEKQLTSIEPNAKTSGLALFSYETAVTEPLSVVKSLSKNLTSSGKVKILTNTRFHGIKGSKTALTNNGDIKFDIFINTAGAYSDRIAHRFSQGLNYKLIPFKGIYKKLSARISDIIKGNIYPVPDLRNPFLGVHFTRSPAGEVYIGPTAIPVLGRENYHGIKGVGLEAVEILCREAVLFATNSKFRETALTEPKKYIFRYFFESAKALLKDLQPDDIKPSAKVGIRPQLIDWRTKELVMDFLIIPDSSSIHILNAISPGFTSSMAFAEYVVGRYIRGR